MDGMEAGIKRNSDEVKANTLLTMDIKKDTQEFLEIFKAVKGGFKVLGWFGTGVKWVGGIAAAGAAVVGAYQALMKLLSK